MGVLADEYIRLRPDVSRMGREVRKAGNDAGRTFGSSFGNAAKAILAGGAILGAAAIVKGIKTTVLAASDMNETMNKSNIIFGKNAKTITKWAADASTSLGLSRQQAIDAAASFGDMFKQLGFSGDAATRMSKSTVQLAADLGSFNNLPTADVQERIAAAFRGEFDSLQKVIPNINAARVQQVALNETGKKSAATLTAQEKAHAVLSIIQKDGARATGDFARTQGGLANQLKIVRAQLSDMAVGIGTVLLPFVTDFANFLTKTAIPAIKDFFKQLKGDEELQASLKRLGDAIKGITGKDFAGTLDLVAQKLPAIVQGMADAAAAVGEFFDAIVAVNGIIGKEARGGMFDSKGPLGFITTFLKNAWREMKDSFIQNHNAILADVSRFISGLVGFFARLPGRVLAWIRKLWADAKVSFRTNHAGILADVRRFLNTVIALFSSWFTRLRTAWATFWATIRRVAATVFTAIRSSITSIWAAIQGVWTRAQTAVRSTWSSFWSNVKSTASAAINSVRTTISTVLTRITSAFSTAKANIKRIWDGLKNVVSAPVEWIRNNVYNTPLVDVWNRVAGLVGGPKLSNFATGGVIPGYEPGRDSVPIMAGRGEAIMRPEWTRAVGKDWVDKANKAARSGKRSLHDFLGESVPGQGGGIGWLKGLVSGVTSKVGSMKDWLLGGLRAAAGKLLDPVKGLINKAMPSSGVGTTVGNIGKKAIDLVLDKIKKVDVIPDLGGGPLGSAIASGGWASIYKILRAAGARSFTTYAGHDQGASRSRDIWPPSQRIAEAARRLSSIWYVIYNRRIASVTYGRRWRAYNGSNPHTDHVHVTLRPGVRAAMGGVVGNGLAAGGIVKGGRGGLNTWIGEGGRDELVSPIPKGWSPANQDAKLDRLIAAIERNGIGGGTTVNLGGVHNPLPEKPSITVNKVMQRVAGLGLV